MAVLLVEQISHERTISRLLTRLHILPAKLEEAYSVSLQRIADQGESDRNLATRILQWVSYTKRPLRIEECLHALAVERDDGSAPPTDLDTRNLLEPQSLVDVCAGLIRIEDTENTLRFVHSTAREFFESKRQDLFSNAVVDISATCLIYLHFRAFLDGPCISDDLFQERITTYPFLKYAAHYWAEHARQVSDSEVERLSFSIIGNINLRGSMLQVMCAPAYRSDNYSQKYPKSTTALHIVARLGLTTVARQILRDSESTDKEVLATGRTPLQEAARYGHTDVVRLLIDKAANVNSTGSDGSALQIAAGRGHSDVVQVLLGHDADANLDVQGEGMGYRSINPYSGSALHRAAAIGSSSVVKMLLEHKADPNIRDYSKGTALHQAVIKGHEDVCNVLLTNGADVDVSDSSGRTPLQQAAAYRQVSIAQLLLKHGADVNARDFCGGVALQRAATNGDIAITRLLLIHGAYPDIAKQFGGSSLQRAAALGHLEIIKLLLQYGAQPDAPDQYGGTALQRATANTREEEVKLLLEHKANPNSMNSTGGTPLRWACSVGHRAIAEMLLRAGGDPNASHPSVEARGTALDRASRNGHETIVELLSRVMLLDTT
jgi:ankyrin repeat protein